MAKETTNLLQEAIASAKQVREVAIQNAYKALEENLTPSIKAMLEGKLEEELDLDESDNEESIEEAANSGFKEVKVKAAPKAKVNEAEEDDDRVEEEPDGDEDGGEADSDHAEPDGDEPVEDDAAEAEPVEDDAEAEAEPVEDEPAADDDTKLEDLTLGDLKALVSDLVMQLQAAPAPEGNEGVDMEPAADVQGQGEEDVPIEDEPEAPVDAAAEPEEGEPAAEDSDNDEEIDLSELLKELEQEERDRKVVTHSQDKELAEVKKALAESRKENKEAINVISELRNTMTDINLLNAKLVYTNRMLAQNLSESQKAKVIKSFDGAKTSAEVKTIYKTLTESFGTKEKTVLKEHRGIASKSAGRSTAAPSIVEVNPVVHRFQQLAGIID